MRAKNKNVVHRVITNRCLLLIDGEKKILSETLSQKTFESFLPILTFEISEHGLGSILGDGLCESQKNKNFFFISLDLSLFSKERIFGKN